MLRPAGLAIAVGLLLALLTGCSDVIRDHLTIRALNHSVQTLYYVRWGTAPRIRIERDSTMTLERVTAADVRRGETLGFTFYKSFDQPFIMVLCRPNPTADLSSGAATTISVEQDSILRNHISVSYDRTYIDWCDFVRLNR